MLNYVTRFFLKINIEMLRTIDINIAIKAGTNVYTFPSNSLGLLSTDSIKGIGIRTSGVNKDNKTLVSEVNLNKAFLNLKENGGKNIHANLSLGKVLEMSKSDRFQMLPISTEKGVYWEESTITMVGDSETTNEALELIIYFVSKEDATNC